jgi:hypothetical protein
MRRGQGAPEQLEAEWRGGHGTDIAFPFVRVPPTRHLAGGAGAEKTAFSKKG